MYRTKPPLSAGIAAGLLIAASLAAPAGADAQSNWPSRYPATAISLDDMSEFRAPPANWRVAGNVAADRARRHHLSAGAGTGVLVNLPGRGQAGNLVTEWEHGDLELELELLVPRGSNSGLYLQGRYELQLFDSWGVETPTFSDMGGIYQRWDESRPEGRRGFEGHPPRVNASRAPGLWQTLHVHFRAPRFDERGNKVQNARFERVVLNGAVIHENVDLTGPTRGAMVAEEAALGPLMIQGDHGPIAFRNIQYKRYSGQQVTLSDLRFAAAEGEFRNLTEAKAAPPIRNGIADGITSGIAGVQDKFVVQYTGTMEIPTSGRYLFDLELDWIGLDPHFAGQVVGGARFAIDGREVLLNDGLEPRNTGSIELAAGRHPFTFTFYKNRPWTSRMAVHLWTEGPQVARQPLHDLRSTPITLPEPIRVSAAGEAIVLRGFVTHGEERRTHTAVVGDPAGVNYAYDLATGALLHLWRGPFADATDMWHGRGEAQLAEPLGSTLTLSGAPALAFLPDGAAPWPDSVADREFRPLGYARDEAGRPTFRYRIGDVEVTDALRPSGDGPSLHRELVARGATGGLFARLAAADRIERLPDGSFAVGDRTYYVALDRGSPRPQVRTANGRQELLVPLQLRGGEARVAYTIVW